MNLSTSLWELAPLDFVRWLRAEGIQRFYFVPDSVGGGLRASHQVLQPVADLIAADRRDYMDHEGLFFQISATYDTLQGAFVHRTCRGQGAGGLRYWHYDTVEDYLRDGLRLAVGMTRKNALAGLWWGGGKGVMAHSPGVDKHDPAIRAELYRDYGRLMSSLKGCYVTAEDVGTHVTDMAHVFEETRFVTCVPATRGGSGNPSGPTARGVVSGMEAALEFLSLGTLEGKSVAVQGMGNVGGPLIGFLLERGVERVIACDIDAGLVARVVDQLADGRLSARVTAPGDESIFATQCDIVAPCATGAVLNPRTIPQLKARIVCGAANNQLEDPERDDQALFARGVVYVPDFLTNRMGIVNCADEASGQVEGDPLFERHLDRQWEHSIHQTALRVLIESRDASVPPDRVALALADKLSLEHHPLMGHRGAQIIGSLVASGWGQSA